MGEDHGPSSEGENGGLDRLLSFKSTGGRKNAHPHACTGDQTWNGSPVRCRKCLGCRRQREWAWMRRVAHEFVAHPSTWFLTLTYRNSASAPPYEAVRTCLKGVRDEFEYLKYLCAEERGTLRDRIHWHVLLHLPCQDTRDAVRASVRWSYGFKDLSRVATARRAGRYVGKYLAKGSQLRASFAYGEGRVVFTPALIAAYDAFPEARLLNVRQGGAPIRAWESHRALRRARDWVHPDGSTTPVWSRTVEEAQVLRDIRLGAYVLDPE